VSYDKNSLNSVQIIGRLGSTPEIKYTPAGVGVVSVSVATTTAYKPKDGEAQETTEWHKCVFWRQLADIIARYGKKGDRVYVSGKLATRTWEKDGVKHYATEIVAEQMLLLEGKKDGGQESNPFEPPAGTLPHAEADRAKNGAREEFPKQADPDDLPF